MYNNNLFMKRIVVILTFFLLFSASGSIVNAQPIFDYEYYKVNIDINKDSTYTVEESFNLLVSGEFHGLRRDIPTDNFCTVATQTCGGFDQIEILEVKDADGVVLSESQYSLYTYEDEDSGKNYLRIEREIYPSGRTLLNETEGWSITYKVYGGIGRLNDGNYFYWNVLPESRGGFTKEANITINFPSRIRENDLTLFDINEYINTSNISGSSVRVKLENLPSVSNFTVAYRFEDDEIDLPAGVKAIITPSVGTEVKIDQLTIPSLPLNVDYLPAGNHTLTISHFGYDTYQREIELVSGKTLDLEQINLEATPAFALFLLGSNILMILCCLTLPLAIFLSYLIYDRRGRDKNPLKTVIPLFSPPVGIKPYLASNLYYEKFKPKMIAATIIDLAVKGIITIKQEENEKDFTLSRTEDVKKYEGLSELENDIISLVFNTAYSVSTTSFKTPSTSRAVKYSRLMKDSYKELVTLKYFQENPETTRAKYAGIAIFTIVIGMLLICGGTMLLTSLGGFFFLCTPGLWLFVFGFGLAVSANYMPAKSIEGSKIFNDLKGFRMYLYTAERFRLQGLSPDEFEKYLPFAMIFDIEKQWAEKFKDLYKTKPEWFDGNISTFNAIYLANSMNNFSSSFTPTSLGMGVSNTSGSGWSGSGGSFGGFSGGGGGGGSSGGW